MLTPYSGHVDPPEGQVFWERAFGVLKIGCLVFLRRLFSSHRFAFQFHSVRIGCQSVKDGVCHGRLVELVMPLGYGELGDDYDRLPAISVFEELQEGQPNVVVQRLQAEVVQDEQAMAFQMVQQLDERTVEPCERHLLDEAVHVEVCRLVP